ncbi:hypothetical protein [Streptomyces sp. NRRL F-5135]|uniref:hypothetical protein n=1 Tax=Streptomyces sp. NRRL F-5135 TaxID=1463858 RepID=UPI0004C65F41|nr:hypothetical protein [Streptomyces sp. NRRL F-5135]
MTRYDHPGTRSGRDEGPGAPVFALAVAWAAGIVVLLVTEYVQATLVYGELAPREGLDTFAGRLTLVHLPNALCVAAAAWAAGRFHRDPFRDRAARHLVAVLTVPVAAQALNLALQWERMTVEDLSLSNAVLVVGCVTGYVADRLQEED